MSYLTSNKYHRVVSAMRKKYGGNRRVNPYRIGITEFVAWRNACNRLSFNLYYGDFGFVSVDSH